MYQNNDPNYRPGTEPFVPQYPENNMPPAYGNNMPPAYGNMPPSYGYPQQGQVYVQQNVQQAKPHHATGFQKLDNHAGVFIKQKLNLTEVITGWQTQNKFYIHALGPDGNKNGAKLFKCKENSDCCARQCLSAACRPFEMDISSIQRNEDDDSAVPFLKLSRPCKCTILCCNRPEMSVTLVEGGQNVYLGKIVEPFTCCSMEQHIYDKDENHKFTIHGSCCQLGFFCKCPCEPCQTFEFSIQTGTGEEIGHIQKRSQGCLKAMISDVDSFAINFPDNSSSSDKALLMSAVLFLDYNYFEEKPNPNRNGNL